MAAKLNSRFYLFVLASSIILLLLASRYVSLNDLAVYGASIENEGVYEGDLAFELLQYGLSAMFGADRVIFGMQITLLSLVVVYICRICRSAGDHVYLVAFLIFTSPVVLVGLTNSIRQSLAFALTLIAFDLRNSLWRIALFSIAVLIHKSSIVLVPIIFLMLSAKKFGTLSPRRTGLFRISFILFAAMALAALFFNDVIDLTRAVYDRYSVYIYSAVVFTEGRMGGEKLIVWTFFWSIALLMPALSNSAWRLPVYPITPLLFTIMVAFDASLRGFDEFHSRLLMFNNVLVLIWFIESLRSARNKNIILSIVLPFNLINPATIGVLT